MELERLIGALKGLSIETGSLACLGCEHEDKCSIKGCAVIREAIARLKNAPGKDTDVPARFAGENHVGRNDQEKWEPCEHFHTCSTCKHDTGDWERDPCYDCGHYKNWELGARFCPRCGRPLTPEAWKELE